MSGNFIKILITTIFLLGQIPNSKADLHTAAYEDFDDQNNVNKGLKHIIHSLRGHYKEEAQRFSKCSSIEKNEIFLTTKPETEGMVATTEKSRATVNSSTTEITISNENPTSLENITSEELPTIESQPATTQSTTGKTSSNEILELTEPTVTTENLATPLLPTSEKLEEATQNISIKDYTTTELNEADLTTLSEILQDTSLPSRRANNKESIINTGSEISSPSFIEISNDSVLDSTQKHFEFESLVIKNEADKDIANKLPHMDRDRNDVSNSEEYNKRRAMPAYFNGRQFPNYYNPFASTIPRSYAAPINPNIYKVKGNHSNNLNQTNPVSSNQIKESLTLNNNPFNSNEYEDSNKMEHVDESDTDLLFKDRNISDEDLNRAASYPTKGFGISEMDKSNLMLIEHPRVCYACTSTNNPSCWSPDGRTPAKYCRRDHDACVAKTYKHRGYAFIVRDCGSACINNGLGDLGLRYRSCTICHSDLCNDAHSISISLKTFIVLFISIWFKYT